MIQIRKEMCPQDHPCPVRPRCPASAIIQDGCNAPRIDQDKCIDCGLCTQMCPVFLKA